MRKLVATHSEFLGNVAMMMSGRTIAAVIALFTMPIVSRLFTPMDFGVAAVFVSVCSTIAPLASLRYEATFVLPEDRREATLLMSCAYRVTIAVTALLAAALLAYESLGLRFETLHMLGHWRLALPLGVFLMTVIHLQESWLTREKRFGVVSTSLVTGNVMTSLSRIGFGALLGTSVYGLILGYVAGLLSRIGLMHESARAGWQALFGHRRRGELWETFRRYSDFPRLNAPAALVFAAGQNLPVIVFGAVFSPAVAGLYAMANRLAQVPVAIVANSLRRVFLQKAATIVQEGRSLRRAFVLSSGTLALIGALPFLAVALVSQEICTWLLGAAWTDAGGFLEIMAPWLFMAWVEAPCNPVFIVLRRQKFWLAMQTSLTLMRLAAFGAAYWLSATPPETLRAFVVASVLGSLVTIVTAWLLIGRADAAQSTP
ncbi:MAG: oligosaccharide flippase family protein [Proteobacteria bacterium]|nr:oligosaccharide flippase family protein [Pseudomonadota bacterium]